jgi:hypothetical protein
LINKTAGALGLSTQLWEIPADQFWKKLDRLRGEEAMDPKKLAEVVKA